MEYSTGHLAVIGAYEYFIHDGLIFRAPLANPLAVNGARQGARYECPASQWEKLAVLIGR